MRLICKDSDIGRRVKTGAMDRKAWNRGTRYLVQIELLVILYFKV